MPTQDLPKGQQIVLWIGIILDFVAKGSLVFELYRFGHKHHWLWFAFTTLFFVVSSLVVAVYWWTHYPGAIADQVVEKSPMTASQIDGVHLLFSETIQGPESVHPLFTPFSKCVHHLHSSRSSKHRL